MKFVAGLEKRGRRALVGGAWGLLVALGLVGCGAGGGGGGGSSRSGVTGSRASAVSEAHWQMALQALGRNYTPASPRFEQAAIDEWNRLLERAWWGDIVLIADGLKRVIGDKLDELVRNSALVLGWRDLQLDFMAPPGFHVDAADALRVMLPAPPKTWRLEATLEIGQVVTTRVAGIPITTTIQGDVRVEVRDLRLVAALAFDLSDPRLPKVRTLSPPQLDMYIGVSSTLPILQQFLPQVSTALDPVLRGALALGGQQLQQLALSGLANAPAQPFGAGGPGVQPVAPPRPLEEVAVQVSDDIMADHTPFGTIAEVVFDQPGYGNGAPVRYGLGDSTIWTGHYLMGEALRWELTGDARALAAIDKVLAGLKDCLDVSPVDGRLSRAVVPDGPFIGSVYGGIDFAWATLRGQRVGTLNDISRDQYVGVFMGMSQAYLRVPSARDRCRDALGRMVGYLDRHDWVARRADGLTPARARYAFTPGQMWAAIKAAHLTDPQRFGTLHDANVELPSMFWASSWASSADPVSKYYKFNLGHDAVTIWCVTETEPARYREYIKNLEILRWATGHHLNAWFNGVYAASVPARAAIWGPVVRESLEAWSVRDRRAHPVDLRNDPTIQTTMFTIPASTLVQYQAASPNANVASTILVARYPIPVEKRRYSDFLWQRSPFWLVGGGDPRHQNPGVDLVQPYWFARSYGLLR